LAAGLPEPFERGADVVEDGGQGQVFLPAFAVAVSAQVKAQRRHPGLTKACSQAGEEAAFLPGDAAAVHEHDGAVAGLVRAGQRAGQVQAVEGPELHDALGGHGRSGPSTGSNPDLPGNAPPGIATQPRKRAAPSVGRLPHAP
jgi:hypothetical protein